MRHGEGEGRQERGEGRVCVSMSRCVCEGVSMWGCMEGTHVSCCRQLCTHVIIAVSCAR